MARTTYRQKQDAVETAIYTGAGVVIGGAIASAVATVTLGVTAVAAPIAGTWHLATLLVRRRNEATADTPCVTIEAEPTTIRQATRKRAPAKSRRSTAPATVVAAG